MKMKFLLYFFLIVQSTLGQYSITRNLPVSQIQGTGNSITLGDDDFSSSLPVGFDLNFFGNLYNSFYINSNGYISFGQGFTNFSVSIPSTSIPNNIIAFAATDLDCSVGIPVINYFTTGISPNQILVVNFIDVQEYNNPTNKTSVQIQCFESSNKIEIHSITNTAGVNGKTIGVENSSGVLGTTDSNLNNNSNLVVNNEMIKFEPCFISPITINSITNTYCNEAITLTVINCNGTVNWSNGAVGQSISVLPIAETTYIANCAINGCTVSASKTLSPAVSSNDIRQISGNNLICSGGNSVLSTFYVLPADSVQWYKDGQPILNQNMKQLYVNSIGSYYLENKKNGCKINSNIITVGITLNKTEKPILIGPNDNWACEGSRVDFEIISSNPTTRFVNDIVFNESTYTGADFSPFIDKYSKIYIIATESGKCNSDTSKNYLINSFKITIENVIEDCGNKFSVVSIPANTPVKSYQWYFGTSRIPIEGVTGKNMYTPQGPHYVRAFLPNGCGSNLMGPFFHDIQIQKPYVYASKVDSLGSTFKTRIKLSLSQNQGIRKTILLTNGDDLTLGSNGANNKFFIQRKGNNGINIWSKSILVNAAYLAFCVDAIENIDGTILICGSSNSIIGNSKTESTKGEYDYWIVKISAIGNVIWDKTIGGSGNDLANFITFSQDGNILISGISNSPISGNKTSAPNKVSPFNLTSDDVWLVKLDQNGNKMFDKVLGAGDDYFTRIRKVKVVQNADKSYIAICDINQGTGGYKSTVSFGNNDIWILKTDSLFNKLWDKSAGGVDEESFTDFLIDQSGSVLVLGSSRSNISGNKSSKYYGENDIFIVKFNSIGQLVWNNTYGGSNDETPISIHKLINSDHYYVVAESSSSNSETKTARNRYNRRNLTWLLKIDNNGIFINDTHIEDRDDNNIPESPKSSSLNNQNELHIYAFSNTHYGKFFTIVNDTTAVPTNSNFKFTTVNCSNPIWSNGYTSGIIEPQNEGIYTVKCGNCLSNKLIFGSPCPSIINLINPRDNYTNTDLNSLASAVNGKILANNILNGNSFRIIFEAKSIELLPGFFTQGAGVFTAKIGGCN